MSKSKNKNRSELEAIRGENRQLRKRLKQLEKQLRLVPEVEPEPPQIEGFHIIEPEKVLCPKCYEGEFKRVIELQDKDIFACNSCDFKKTVKK